MTITEIESSVSAAYPLHSPHLIAEQRSRTVLGVPISSLTMEEAISRVNAWIVAGSPTRLVTFTNVHMVVEAQIRPGFQKLMQNMDMNCPDGAPIFWLTRREHATAEKISGPDFMPLFCKHSVVLGHRHFFYGGAPDVARHTAQVLSERFPGLQIAGHLSPPFRDLTDEETEAVIEKINATNADLVWVCLGCPRQEAWISKHREKLNAKVVLAVGQAFDIVAGRTSRAPAALRACGLEWFYRLCQEPTRLWKRYLVTNLLFSLLIVRDKLGRKLA